MTDATRDLGWREIAAVGPLLAALVLFGFYPAPLLDVANPMVDELLAHVGVSDDGPTVPAEEVAHSETEEGH